MTVEPKEDLPNEAHSDTTTTNHTRPQSGRNDEIEENFLGQRLDRLERQVQLLRQELVWTREHRGKLESQVQHLREELVSSREHLRNIRQTGMSSHA